MAATVDKAYDGPPLVSKFNWLLSACCIMPVVGHMLKKSPIYYCSSCRRIIKGVRNDSDV